MKKIKKYVNKMISIHNSEKEKFKGAVINNIVTIIFTLCTNIIGKIAALLKRFIPDKDTGKIRIRIQKPWRFSKQLISYNPIF